MYGGLVNQQWVEERRGAGIPQGLLRYCTHHAFVRSVSKEGNLKAIMAAMGMRMRRSR